MSIKNFGKCEGIFNSKTGEERFPKLSTVVFTDGRGKTVEYDVVGYLRREIAQNGKRVFGFTPELAYQQQWDNNPTVWAKTNLHSLWIKAQQEIEAGREITLEIRK